MKRSSHDILKQAPVVPVITLERAEDAIPLARALLAGGIPVLEITLRTKAGLESIRQIKDQVDGAIVGAGTVVNAESLEQALNAGSEFIITPGCTDGLLAEGMACGVPFMPGVSTVSELMRGMEAGLNTFKFFPAEASGGAKAVAAFEGPFPQVTFCPTGGIGPSNIATYLALSSVMSVGGTWIAPKSLIAEKNWNGITQLAREACELVDHIRNHT